MNSETLRRTVAKNAGANLARLAGSGVVALLLPPFLVRTLSKDVYGAWALLLQLTLYVGYLDFGIQTAVARFIAHAAELRDCRQRDGIVSTAFAMLTVAAIIGITVIFALALRIPQLFRGMPESLYHAAKVCLLLMGGSFALGLPLSVIQAFFIGLQRNEVPAAIAILNKVLMAVLTVAAALKHLGLIAMGAAVAIANCVGYVVIIIVWRLWGGTTRLRAAFVTPHYVREIGGYSASVVVWILAGFMISGLDLTIVGIFDYHSTAYYAIAATLTSFVAQAQGAIFSALLPASAVLGARGEAGELGALLLASTRYGMIILLLMASPLIAAGHLVLKLWAGADYAQHSTLILQILLVANVIRLCALPYATLLLGTGQQKQVIISPLAEGFTNLTSSIIGAYFLGAIGVALGTLIGSFVSIGMHLFYNMPRTARILINRAQLVRESLLRPAFCVAPFIVLLVLRELAPALITSARVSLTAAAAIGTVLLIWHYALIPPERQKLAHALRLL